MGAGLAAQFKKKFIRNFHAYALACKEGDCEIGKVFMTYENNDDGLAIANFPTKNHWKAFSQIEWIAYGLKDLKQYINAGDRIALPLLGCGLGGLDKADVITLIVHHLNGIDDVEVILCIPYSNPLRDLL